ncbi:hypothetical protein E4T44_02544 [Aureobasidium sp. EXF-8845]|nr:hypothetical protein E4T44_02544 [Aureobasidium sp. EXF-8845]KAI4856055.1 hypothetical protein E4T45_02491 [Aureobasidium sp. EXF-8846]
MAFTRSANTTTASKPSLLNRLKGNNRTVTTTTKHSSNPITGSHTTTTTKKEVGAGHHASHHTGTTAGTSRTTGSSTRHTTSHRTTGTTTGATRVQKRKPTIGDKVSGAMMNLKGTVTGKPGVKVNPNGRKQIACSVANSLLQGAGTRRMNGTDGKGSHYTRTY